MVAGLSAVQNLNSILAADCINDPAAIAQVAQCVDDVTAEFQSGIDEFYEADLDEQCDLAIDFVVEMISCAADCDLFNCEEEAGVVVSELQAEGCNVNVEEVCSRVNPAPKIVVPTLAGLVVAAVARFMV